MSGGRQTQSVHFATPGFYKTWEINYVTTWSFRTYIFSTNRQVFCETIWWRNWDVHDHNNTLLYWISPLTVWRMKLQKLNNLWKARTNHNCYKQVMLQKEVKTVFKYSKLWIRLHYAINVYLNRKQLWHTPTFEIIHHLYTEKIMDTVTGFGRTKCTRRSIISL
jgi:hypothetical protein